MWVDVPWRSAWLCGHSPLDQHIAWEGIVKFGGSRVEYVDRERSSTTRIGNGWWGDSADDCVGTTDESSSPDIRVHIGNDGGPTW